MSIGLQLILSTTLATVQPGCSWAHPGANPYRGDPVAVLADFDLAPATRDKLRALMRAHRHTDVATITRDDIVGADGGYRDLREMHSGHGRVCHGEVDRSAWRATRRERALVYCADDACVIVPTICNNVSLASRKPRHVAAQEDSPIDIEPAAGPPRMPPDASAPPSPDDRPLEFLPPAAGGGDTPVGPAVPIAPGGGGDSPGPVVPIAPGGPVGGDGSGPPTGNAPGGGDGGLPCCDLVPIAPGSPGTPPIISVPEAPTALLLSAGLVLLAAWRRRR